MSKSKKRTEIYITIAEILAIFVTIGFAVGYVIKNNTPRNKTAMETIKVYALSENPKFEIPAQSLGAIKDKPDIEVKHSTGVPVDVNVKTEKAQNGNYEVTLERSETFRPGKYLMVVKGQNEAIYKDFYWGVLAVNTNKSLYSKNDEALLQLAVLDQWGHTQCDANVELKVKTPSGRTNTLDIEKNSTCDRDNVVDTADYLSKYKVTETGTYTLTLTNLDNGFTLATQFKSVDKADFSVERLGATRINPFKADYYTMTIKVKANQNFDGSLEEYLPKSFKADGQDANKITWNINLRKGEEKTYSYNYTSPSLSPEFYLLGPIRLVSNGNVVFEEERGWQIASDAAKTAAASGSWSTNATWGATSPPPVAGDTVTIGNYRIVVGAGASAASINLSASGANVEVRNGFVLQLSSAFILNSNAGGNVSAVLSGPGTVNVPILQVGTYTAPTGVRQVRLILGVNTLNITKDLVITSTSGSSTSRVYSSFADLTTGSVNVISVRAIRQNTCTFCSAGVTMNTGGQSAVLSISGSNPWQFQAMRIPNTLTGTNAVVNYNGTAAQTLPASSANTYTTMQVNNTAGVTLSGSITTTTLSIGNNTTNSVFNDGTNNVISTGTLNLVSGSYIVGRAWPSFATNNISAGTMVDYNQTDQAVSVTPTYSHLTLSNTGTYTPAAGTLTVTSNWTVNGITALDTNNTVVSTSGISGTGAITQGSGNISLNGDWTNTGSFTAGSADVIFTGTSDIISGSDGGMTFWGLKINGTITNSMPGTIIVNSALSGTGTLFQGSGAYLDINGDATLTNLVAGTNPNTVAYTGVGNQSITGGSYFYYNLALSSPGSPVAARTITFAGNSVSKVSAGGSISFKGANGNLLTLQSSDANTWKLQVDPTASLSISYVSATNSDATGYKLIDAADGTNVDGGAGGTNLNWIFEYPPNFLYMDGFEVEGLSLD